MVEITPFGSHQTSVTLSTFKVNSGRLGSFIFENETFRRTVWKLR